MNFDRMIDRHNTGSVKHDLIRKRGLDPDTLPMWVADMDFQAPECVRKALQEAAEYGIFGYSFADEGYFEAVQNWFLTRFDWQVQKQWLVCTPGVVTALNIAVRAATEPGDSVMIQSPVYYPFYNVIQNNGRVVVENPLRYENGVYAVDFADMEEKICHHNVKMLILIHINILAL